MWKRFDRFYSEGLESPLRGISITLLLFVLTLSLAGCYTTFRPPLTAGQPPTIVYDSTAISSAPTKGYSDDDNYPPAPNYWWNNYWGWRYPYWGTIYPYGYNNYNSWGRYYYEPWWGNYYYGPSYPYSPPYYSSPSPGSPGPPQEKRSFGPRGETMMPPPSIPAVQTPPPAAPPPPNQGQQQQNPPNNDDNKKRETDRRGRRG